MKREKIYNRHHLCPSSRGGASTDSNIEVIRMSTHDAIHTLFSNEIFPEQIETLTALTSKALLPEIQKELIERLNARDIHDPTQRYREGSLLLPKHHKWKNTDTE